MVSLPRQKREQDDDRNRNAKKPEKDAATHDAISRDCDQRVLNPWAAD
jgi:hypothetical protein